MKNGIAAIILFTLISIAIPGKSYAVNMGVGMTSWFSWWEFNSEGSSDMEFDPAFLYGPALSLGFNPKWKLSAVFLYGEYDIIANNDQDKFDRYDLDVALNYIINDTFKIFGGGKFMGFDYPGGGHFAGGPGIGVGTTFNLYGNFYLLGNLSLIFLYGVHDSENNFYELAINSSLSLAYYIDPISTTISLGFRYQFLKTWYEDENTSMDNFTSHFYGVTLSAVFSFNI